MQTMINYTFFLMKTALIVLIVMAITGIRTRSIIFTDSNDIANINPEVTLKKKEIVNNNNKKIHFLICGSCFWCASHFNNIGDMIVKCPSCRSNNKVESIPVSYDEVYKFDYDPKRGVVLEFSKVDEGRRRS